MAIVPTNSNVVKSTTSTMKMISSRQMSMQLRTQGGRPMVMRSTNKTSGREIKFVSGVQSPLLRSHVCVSSNKGIITRFSSSSSSSDDDNGVTGAFDSESGTTNVQNLYSGISREPFEKRIADILSTPVSWEDIEIKPDGLLYLPEIKYRRYLNHAFGPGGWGMVPIGPPEIHNKSMSREYGLFCMGRFVSQARGEQDYSPNGFMSFASANESIKSNALMRCCKDLGIASELWDPVFIRDFKAKNCVNVFCDNIRTKEKRMLWRRKDGTINYPWKEQGSSNRTTTTRTTKTTTSAASSSSGNTASSSSSSSSSSSGSLNLQDQVPAFFKKFQGNTWRQLLEDPKAKQYLTWVLSSDADDKIKDAARKGIAMLK